MSIKIAITNEKGGCGKTTSAVNISAILAERGYRVLLADVDPQSYATMYYGLYNADDPSLYDAITGVWPVNDAIVKTVFGVDVLKSNTKSMRLEEMLTEYKLRGRAYNDLLSKLLTPIESDYDYIIIDCPPQGYKLLENVQRYADYILIPMIPDEFALHSLRIKAESLIEIRRTINPHLRLLGGLIIMDEKNGTKAIWNCEDLLDYYVEMMPTPQEAVKDILKPKYGYHGGTLIMKHFNGSYECTSSKLILQNGAMQTIAAYTYNEADTMIRKLYRDGELCPERQDAK